MLGFYIDEQVRRDDAVLHRPTDQHPVRRASARTVRLIGEFHDVTSATMPTGLRCTKLCWPAINEGSINPTGLCA